jgi:hypothetical protein
VNSRPVIHGRLENVIVDESALHKPPVFIARVPQPLQSFIMAEDEFFEGGLPSVGIARL